MGYKLICTDLDGTLLTKSGGISSRNLESIRGTKEHGVDFSIATGRMLYGALLLTKYYGITPYMVCSNGAMILSPEGEILLCRSLNAEIIERVYTIGNQYQCSMGYNTKSEAIFNRRNHFEPILYTNVNEQFGYDETFSIEVKYEEGYTVPKSKDVPLKISLWADTQESFDGVMESFSKMDDISITSSAKWNVEVTAKGVTKWSGIEELMKLLEIEQQQVVCMGDSLNDSEMVKNAGLGVCMENGVPELRQMADYIAKTNEEDGVTDTIEKCYLGIL